MPRPKSESRRYPSSEMIRRARLLRRNQTDAEYKLWQVLRNRQLEGHGFRRQFPIGRFIVDFCCFEARLVVELDGGQHAEAAEQDARRDAFLTATGYRVLRFWDSEVFENLEGVYYRIFEDLTLRPHPAPLPPGEVQKRGHTK